MQNIRSCILIIILSTLLSGCSSNSSITQLDTIKVEQKETVQPQIIVYKVGDVVNIRDNRFTVNKFTRSSGNDTVTSRKGFKYVIVNVTVENKGNVIISYNTYDFNMLNSDGQIQDPIISTVDRGTALRLGDLVPGGKASGTVVFEEPENDHGLKLQYTPSYSSGNVIEVTLND